MRKYNRLKYVIILFSILIHGVNAYAAKDDSESKFGRAAFRQLPEDIQIRIIDEATLARRECSKSRNYSGHYSCDCVKEEFINIRTIHGPEINWQSLTQDARNRCVSPDSISKYYRTSCIVTENRKIINADAYCQCFGDKMATKFVKRPAFSSDFLSLLHKESYKACGYNKYQRIK